MKEVTYEDWQKNPTPRMMWVWDDNEEDKHQRKVIYFLGSKVPYPVVVLTADESAFDMYMHCAEIELNRSKTMTIEEAIKHIDEVVSNGAMCEECNKEHLQLKQWLLENIELKKEIEEPKIRRMTNKELSRWVREKTTREWKYNHVNYIYSFYIYTEGCADEEVCDRIVIREDDGERRAYLNKINSTIDDREKRKHKADLC